VREATAKQLLENEEIKNLKTILGLKEGAKHEGCDGLRYGSIIILTDSDADGSHIRGLILNFLHAKWPELAKSGFVKVMQTPIVRAKKVRKHIFCRQFVPLWQFGGFSSTFSNKRVPPATN
jgi:DNA topoisomerase-2